MRTDVFRCRHCGANTQYSYFDTAYSDLSSESKKVVVVCINHECRKPVGEVREY